jgi:hypothetical protein
MSRISKADRQLQLQREEAGDHLFANRVKVYPKSVRGPVRRFKWAVLIVCLTIYYLLPWIRWNRGVNRLGSSWLLLVIRFLLQTIRNAKRQTAEKLLRYKPRKTRAGNALRAMLRLTETPLTRPLSNPSSMPGES